MKCIAAVDVDLERSPIGTASRARADLCGVPVLTRTVRRLTQVRRVDHVFVLCPPDQSATCRDLVPADLEACVTVRPNRIASAPFRKLVRAARKWSLDGWRGGLGGTCSMDEYTRTDELALLANDESADAVVCVSGSAPLIDPDLTDGMIAQTEQTVDEAKITFAQAPPGLTGTVYRRNLLFEMGAQHIPPGFVLSYKPDAPLMDLAFKSCCYTAAAPIRHACARLIVDTDRSLQTVRAFLESSRPVEADTIGRWLIERSGTHVDDLPREVEIELTTADQLAGAMLRPRGNRIGRAVGNAPVRGPIDLALVERLACELAAFDDSLVVFGGFGEPLLHPRFADAVRICREAGIFGIAVRTNGLALDDATADVLIDYGVDVVNVLLDAWTPALYGTVQGDHQLEHVRRNVSNLSARRSQRASVVPLLVPEMVKSVETVGEMDAFFDGWVRECGWACIRGYNHYGHRLEDRSVMRMAPPTRTACRRIMHRALVLADGRVPLCDQDFTGDHTIGDLHETSLRNLWGGSAMTDARRRHYRGTFDALPLCAACEEWHRP